MAMRFSNSAKILYKLHIKNKKEYIGNKELKLIKIGVITIR